VIVHGPPVRIDTVVPDTVHTLVVLEPNVTARPLVADPDTVNDPPGE